MSESIKIMFSVWVVVLSFLAFLLRVAQEFDEAKQPSKECPFFGYCYEDYMNLPATAEMCQDMEKYPIDRCGTYQRYLLKEVEK